MAVSIDFTGINVTTTSVGGASTVYIPTAVRDVIANRPSAAAAENVLFIASDQGDAMSYSDGSTWDDLTTPGTPTYRSQVSSGTINLTSSTWADLNNGLDLVIPAVAGDIIEVSIQAVGKPVSGSDSQFDVQLVASGSTVSSSGNGIPSWYLPNTSISSFGLGGGMQYVVQSGDISSGNVTMRMRYRGQGGLGASVRADATFPFIFQAVNLGQ